MSKISLKPNASGTGVFSLEAPNSNVDRTLNLPDEAGTVLTDSGALNVDPSAPTQSATIDSSGNLLVGKSTQNTNTIGSEIHPDGLIAGTRSGLVSVFDRLGSNGEITRFKKDGNTVGSVASMSGSNIQIGSGNVGLRFFDTGDAIYPVNNSTNLDRDNAVDLGRSVVRFDDIFATNGTIQTSDVNEKQDVEELSDAEARVAAKAKTLLRKYRWKSAVEEKGDEARIHFGIIAQDLEQAFIDEGLDAGRYGMFIRGEWYEAEVEKTRTVENDDGTKTTETYMATETYDSAEEAPEGAVKKERLGVRYHELLAFIIAAI